MTRSLAIIGALAGLLYSPLNHAGFQYAYHVCLSNSDGSGACWGTLKSFRDSSNANDYAVFSEASGSNSGFSANYNGIFYSCQVPASATKLNSMWPQAVLSQGYFIVNWNASRECVALTLRDGSMYHDL